LSAAGGGKQARGAKRRDHQSSHGTPPERDSAKYRSGRYLSPTESFHVPGARAPGRLFLWPRQMIEQMREELGKGLEELSRELTVTLPQAIATAVAMGDLRENSEYKAALERQQLVQARLGQLHLRLAQLAQLANTEAPRDRVGLGSRVVVEDLGSGDQETYVL